MWIHLGHTSGPKASWGGFNLNYKWLFTAAAHTVENWTCLENFHDKMPNIEKDVWFSLCQPFIISFIYVSLAPATWMTQQTGGLEYRKTAFCCYLCVIYRVKDCEDADIALEVRRWKTNRVKIQQTIHGSENVFFVLSRRKKKKSHSVTCLSYFEFACSAVWLLHKGTLGRPCLNDYCCP